MKINFSEIANWTGVAIIVLAIGSCTGFMVVDIKSSHEEMKENNQIRAENGGALPNIEAIDKNGDTYGVDKITFEGVNYICFKQGRRMGCVKEQL